jgi:hypothetical protein
VAGRALGSASKFSASVDGEDATALTARVSCLHSRSLAPERIDGQDADFGRDADVRVREDSFACRETSELDRLLQRNQSGGFTSGVQLYEYLQSHNRTIRRTRACVRDTGAVRLHLRSEGQE